MKVPMKVTHNTKGRERFLNYKGVNELEDCKVAGCGKKRCRVSHFCGKHSQRKHASGHPLGLMKPPRTHVLEDQLLQEVLSLNISSSSVQIGLKRISSIIESANLGENWMPEKAVWQSLFDRKYHENPREVLFRLTRLMVIARLEKPYEWASKSDDFLHALIGNQIYVLSQIPPEQIFRNFSKRKAMYIFINREIGVLMLKLTEAVIRRYEEQYNALSPFMEDLQH